MSSRPDWVPQWIWEKYMGLRERDISIRPSQASIEMLDKLIADSRCDVVWKALTKRKGLEFKAYREERGSSDSEGVVWDHVEILLCRIPILASGLLEEDKISRTERAIQGARIARAAAELHSALGEARLVARWPNPLSYAYGEQALEVAEGGDYGELNGWENVVFYDPDAALHVLHSSLRALSSAAEAWSSWHSLVPRPKDPNAARLRFIREITGLFRRMYGSPLREPVAALVSVVFECDMDASTVAKLDRERASRN